MAILVAVAKLEVPPAAVQPPVPERHTAAPAPDIYMRPTVAPVYTDA